jgi:DNA-binding beta-propeller fold protein YncE
MFVWTALQGLRQRVGLRRQVGLNGRGRCRPLAVESLETRLCLTSYIYISSFGTNTVERYEEGRWAPAPADGQTGATLVAHNSGGVNHPLGVTISPYDGNLLVCSLETNQVLKYDINTGAYLGEFVTADSGGLENPSGILFGPDGNLYVASTGNDEILRYDGQTGAFSDVYLSLSQSGGLTGMVWGPDGALYCSTRFDNNVIRYDGTTVSNFVQPGDGGLSRTGGVIFGNDGNLYVTSEATNNVLRYDGQTGAFIDEFVHAGSGGLSRPGGLLFGPWGDLYVSSIGTNAILHYDWQTGALINAEITQHDANVISGPRAIFFTETDPGTLNYNYGMAPHGHSGGSGSNGHPHPGTVAANDLAEAERTVTILARGSSTLAQWPPAPAPVVSAALPAQAEITHGWSNPTPLAGLDVHSAQPAGQAGDARDVVFSAPEDLDTWGSPLDSRVE